MSWSVLPKTGLDIEGPGLGAPGDAPYAERQSITVPAGPAPCNMLWNLSVHFLGNFFDS